VATGGSRHCSIYVLWTLHESVEPAPSRRDIDRVRVNPWSLTDKFASCTMCIYKTPTNTSSDLERI